jgi:uncharacterized paraquat-inducible protein A
MQDEPHMLDAFHAMIEQVISVHQRTSETECTCKEFQHDRALCPVCDKEEYDKAQQDISKLKSKK